MAKPRLTFIGHSYHAQTGSSDFMRALLESAFEVTVLWDDSWRPGSAPLDADAINRTDPEHVVLYQQIPSRREYARIHCRNVTWVPMHDAFGPGPQWKGWQPSGLKILCFCAADAAYFAGLGYDTLRVQYFPPAQVREPGATAAFSIFFWPRRNEIGWSTLKALLGAERPQRIVLRVAADPGHAPELPVAEDCRRYAVDVQEGWMDEAQYRSLVTECTLFMAPRPREGIGQALLEARALGLVAIAPNAATMNEYISDRVNGYLYDIESPAAIDFSGVEELRRRSLADLAAGRRAWVASQPSVIEFISKPARPQPLWWRVRSRLTRG